MSNKNEEVKFCIYQKYLRCQPEQLNQYTVTTLASAHCFDAKSLSALAPKIKKYIISAPLPLLHIGQLSAPGALARVVTVL